MQTDSGVYSGLSNPKSVQELERGLRAGFIDSSIPCTDDSKPQLIYNEKSAGGDLLSVVKRQLLSCGAFDFCVAFVADSGLQTLIEVLLELERRGIKGRFLTSTYLNFNSPAALRKLLDFSNIETRVYQGDLHAKGYLFERGETSTVIVGSSNLTQRALTCNREWNVLFQSYGSGGMLEAIEAEFSALWNDSQTAALDETWIDQYESYRADDQVSRPRRPAFHVGGHIVAEFNGSQKEITPNAMQRQALEALHALHGRNVPRALLVSATGTGKTYLSAFDVLAVHPARILFLVHRKRILTASMKSYRNVLGERYTYGLYEAGKDCSQTSCLFAMCSTMVRHLEEFAPDAFDYIVIDEAHRTGSETYQRIVEHFTPKFLFGMTATPNRTNDDFDVFELFNHVIAFQITLQDALENEMLVPFHYFGIADLAIDYEEQDDVALFARLTSEERVRHIVEKINEYTVDAGNRRGLIFCSRNDEARELSEKFNQLGFRTECVSGNDGDKARDAKIANLESGATEYLFSVDVFNEGIDIPLVNQIIMLRRTDSAIVFVQQLGRGLRKADGKEYTLVLDFIGNYQKNFFVPVALSGDRTFNKDKLRTIVKEGSAAIPGCSTISFDPVSETRIYRAIDAGKFTESKFLKGEYEGLRRMLGRIPRLMEFDENNSIDPLLIFKKYGSYHAFLSKCEERYSVRFSPRQSMVLKFISQKLANGKRACELLTLKELILAAGLPAASALGQMQRVPSAQKALAAEVLSGAFAPLGKDCPALVDEQGSGLTDSFENLLKDTEFRRQVLEVIEFGLHRYERLYATVYKDTDLVLNAKYTYEEACRLLRWPKNVNGQNIGGYKYDEATNTFPVFINYDKDPTINDSIKYEDRFLSSEEIIAISKQPRYLHSPEIKRLQDWPRNGMKIYLFMRKNKDDGESKEFYFFGEMAPTGSFQEIVMPGANKAAVEITYKLEEPIRADLYSFMTSNVSV